MIELPNHSYTLTTLPEFVSIGKYSSVAEDVRFYGINEQHRCVINKKCVYTTRWDQPTITGTISIGSDVWIGEDCKIFADSKIGDGCIIGAGSVFHGDIPPYAIVYGNPAKVRKFRFTTKQVEQLMKIQWWNRDDLNLPERAVDLQNIYKFLEKYG